MKSAEWWAEQSRLIDESIERMEKLLDERKAISDERYEALTGICAGMEKEIDNLKGKLYESEQVVNHMTEGAVA